MRMTTNQNNASACLTGIARNLITVLLFVLCSTQAYGQSVGFPVGEPKGQWFLDSGAVCASCTLTFYAAGTTTPQEVYTDSSLTVAASTLGVLTLNSSGRAFAYCSTAPYKIFLKTSGGTTIWTIDNYYCGAGVQAYAVLSKSANYTVSVTDGLDLLLKCDASGGTVTIAPYTAVGYSGRRITVLKSDSSVTGCVVDPNGAQTVGGLTTWHVGAVNGWVTFESDGANWQIVGRWGQNITAVSGTYTALVDDDVIDATSGTFSVTLYTAVGHRGQLLEVVNAGTGVVTVDGATTETVSGALTLALSQYDAVTLVSDGTNWLIQ